VISLGMLAQGHDDFWDFAWLLVGGYLCVEQIVRRRRFGQGHPAGSVLGALVRPLARSLLEPAASPWRFRARRLHCRRPRIRRRQCPATKSSPALSDAFCQLSYLPTSPPSLPRSG